MRPFTENDIKQEIQHIFDSGANETRVFELVRNLLARQSDEFPDPEELKSFEDWAKREEHVPKSQLTPDQFISEAKLAFKELHDIYRDSHRFIEPNENYLDPDAFAQSMDERFFYGGKNDFWRLLDCEIITDTHKSAKSFRKIGHIVPIREKINVGPYTVTPIGHVPKAGENNIWIEKDTGEGMSIDLDYIWKLL